MAAATSNNKLLEKLSERFPVEDVKQRRQGNMQLDYISIDATIRRLNDVLGTEWSFSVDSSDLRFAPNGNGYLAVVSGTLEALGKTASGVGADSAGDPDKAIKTALAEAIKKAGHQFGIGLYLWDESEREVIAKARRGIERKTQETSVSKAGSDSFGGSW